MLGASTSSDLPQGVYINDINGFELDGGDATFNKDDSMTIQAVTGSKVRLQCYRVQESPPKSNAAPVLIFSHQSTIQIEVVDVAASVATTQSTGIALTAAAVQPTTTTAAPKSGTKGGWSMQQLKPILGQFIDNFTHILVLKVINFVSNTASGAWKLTGVNLVDAVKDLAAESFPEGLVFAIAPRQPFYEVVSAWSR